MRFCQINPNPNPNHMYTTYKEITDNGLHLNNIKMNAAYNVNLPIKVLFDQVEDGMDYANTKNHPKTLDQIVMTGQQLIQDTGVLTDDFKVWKRLPDPDKTWVRFKMEFSLEHQELRENKIVG